MILTQNCCHCSHVQDIVIYVIVVVPNKIKAGLRDWSLFLFCGLYTHPQTSGELVLGSLDVSSVCDAVGFNLLVDTVGGDSLNGIDTEIGEFLCETQVSVGLLWSRLERKKQ